MQFDRYQKEARAFAFYPVVDQRYVYPALGLAGEAGEGAEKIKKLLRDKGGHWSEEDKNGIERELGDCLWYISQVAWEFELSLESVARANLEKLRSRSGRGRLGGSGDNR